MIKIGVRGVAARATVGNSNVNGWNIELPSVPRIGERLIIGDTTITVYDVCYVPGHEPPVIISGEF